MAPPGVEVRVRSAALLLVVQGHHRAGRIGLDRQHRRLGQGPERELHVEVATLAGHQLALLAHVAVRLHGHDVLTGCELPLERRASNHRAVQEHVGVGGFADHRERGRTARLARQIDLHFHLPAARLHVELLLGAAAVGRGHGHAVQARQKRHGEGRLAHLVVIDADRGSRLDGAEGVGDRHRRRIERRAFERPARRAQPGGAAFLVLRLDEVLERSFGEHRGGQRCPEPAPALLAHGEGFVAGSAGPAGEHQRREQVRRIEDPGLDGDRLSPRRLFQRGVLDLRVARFRCLGLALRRGGFLVDRQQNFLAPLSVGRASNTSRRRGDQKDCEDHFTSTPPLLGPWADAGGGLCPPVVVGLLLWRACPRLFARQPSTLQGGVVTSGGHCGPARDAIASSHVGRGISRPLRAG